MLRKIISKHNNFPKLDEEIEQFETNLSSLIQTYN